MNEMLPAYAAGSLSDADRDRVRAHLTGCARCRADLAAWRAIAGAAAPGDAAPDAASMVHAVLTRSAIEGPAGPPGEGPRTRRPLYAAALVAAEARLIRLAVPVASALVMALGVVIALVQAAAVARPATGAEVVLALVAPIVAAAGVAGTYRSRRDPATELVAATPAAGRLLLVVRLVLVFGYDLVLAVAASAALAAAGVDGTAGLHALIAAWLGPMALLSSVSLLVSVRFGPDVGLGAAIGLWAMRVLAGSVWSRDDWAARFIVDAWSTNVAVLAVSAVFGIVAVVMAGHLGPYDGEPRRGRGATHPT
ncbi:zf-HC2 domain-containing protein [Actinomadura madurae]|uniref:zf-HC2 domain-containing protein n=1 Tax=Actinomadura madurae TaxID=1993 RepID=UPI002025FC9A|nr:zf-HC2 domain-containing protein [Actinomadura madurae]MCQ0008736.1 zf-HC2 domain-containing protein [Actinomadura madurae]URM96038.1 zf-HC2 domain-containing protein [Actinomadura madurae]